MAPRRSARLVPLLCLALVLALSAPAVAADAADAASPGAAPPDAAAPSRPGEVSTIPNWQLQSSAVDTAPGEVVSRPGFPARGWLRVSARSTVMAGLIENGRYPDLNYSTNLRDAVNPADFTVPWWYRRTFVAQPRPGRHTFLRLNGGVIARGEIWLNGTRIAGGDQVAGAYPAQELDITEHLRSGRNALAIKAIPGDPNKELLVSFLDWSPPPPDNNTGIWRDVQLATTGPVSLVDSRVSTALALPGLDRADLTVRAEVRNNTDRPLRTEIDGRVGSIRLRQTVELPPRETRTVTFAPDAHPQLVLRHPRVWWPAQLGDQPLYRLDLTARVDRAVSDERGSTFGIRDVKAPLNAQGDRRFEINGRPLLIRGAGWASDLFLRTQPQRLADQLRYVRDLGLNTLRLEGKQEDHELVELADRMGIMVLPGWECCTKWEKYGTWTDSDLAVAAASARSEARRLRDHPSVIGFLVGSDAAPPAAVERAYLDAFRSVDWQTPIISSAKRLSSPELGTSGMKMDGPYWWVPPNYWYNDRLGGAFGFASEVGPGPTIPELDSLRRYLSPAEIEDLWRHPDRRHYHLAQKEVFGTLTLFARAMNLRHGPPRDRDDFLRKAQLMNYEANRAQMEAFGRDFSDPARPATGVIYWMLNNAWPTLYWHLWDYNLAPAGSYFGAKNALRPLHVQYSYDDRSAVIVNTGPKDARGLTVRSTVFSVDGTVLADETVGGRDVGSGSALRALTVPRSQGTHLLRLLLLDSEGRQVDRNVYWLSDRVDELDYANSTWWHTPITSGADYTGLQSMPEARIATSVRTEPGPDGTLRTVVTIRNPAGSGPAAFFLRANLRRGPDGDQVTPVRWSDNYVTLWPGESTELRAEYRAGDLGGARPHVEVTGWNTPRVG